MTIKIIKEPTIRRYKATCPICGCEFEFDTTDIRGSYIAVGLGTGISWQVECPKCDFNINVWDAENITDGENRQTEITDEK